jgi:hypothetical protein
MKIQSAASVAAALVATIGTLSTASAQDASDTGAYGGWEGEGEVPAPRDAFELTLGSGYTQGFGNLQEGSAVNDTAKAGVGLELGLANRFSPHWSAGINGGYQLFDTGDQLIEDSMPRGVTGRIDVTYHSAPYSRVDPWFKLATGYRYLFERNQPGGNAHLHGLELANLSTGLDLRLDRQFGLAPVIGGGLNMFLWRGTDTIDDPRLSAFVFAGLQVRFDFGGSYGRPLPPEVALR